MPRGFLSDIEKARREEQSKQAPHHRTGKNQTTREKRREQQRAGEVAIFNARETFKLDYKFSIPPGILRDDNPVMVAGTLVADNECDILRGIFVKLAEQCGYGRPEFGRAVTGMFAEIINPLSMNLRAMIAMQIAQGSGLDIRVQEITSCVDCGAEQEIVDIMLPAAITPTVSLSELEAGDESANGDHEYEFARQEDQTVHRPECPTYGRPDIEWIAEHPEAEAEGCSPPHLPGKTPEWKTGPALLILHPNKYQPLMTPPSADAMAIPDYADMPEDQDKILEFPSAYDDSDDPPTAGLV